jgi:hypothetical protein
MTVASLTVFTDFVQSSGKRRTGKVKAAVRQQTPAYSKDGDYYRLLRGRVISYIRRKRTYKELLDVVDLAKQGHKKKNYRECLASVSRMMANHSITWVGTLKGLWECGSLSVRVNPEFVVSLDGKLYATRMYFRKDELSDVGKGCILFLINNIIADSNCDYSPAIWDIRREMIITESSVKLLPISLMQAEASAFEMLWNELSAA